MKPAIRKGPLNKNHSTYLCEYILTALLFNKKNITKFYLEPKSNDIILIITSLNEKNKAEEYNITLLFRYANLQHLCFSNETLQEYEKYLESKEDLQVSCLSLRVKKKVVQDKTLPSLTLAEKTAIAIYTKYYNSFNLILRGQNFSDELASFRLTTQEDLNSYLKEIICAILIAAHGLTKIQHAGRSRPLYRIEENKDSIQDVLQQRIHATQSTENKGKIVTSQGFYSTAEDGFSFSGHDSKDIFLNIKAQSLSIAPIAWNQKEEEVILTPHTQILFSEHFTVDNFHMFMGQVVCSPDGEIIDRYLPDHAIRFLLPNFKKPYTEGYLFGNVDNQEIVNGQKIERPNHGLVYALCVKNLVYPVADYLSKHAKNPYLRKYCEQLTVSKIIFLETMAQFLKVGRRSEISWGQNKKAYEDYQVESVKRFLDYITKFDYLFPKKQLEDEFKEIKSIAEVIKSFGDPVFLEKNANNPYGCMAKIFDICHNLHLQRCMEAKDYQGIIKSIEKKHSIASFQQTKDLLALLLLSQSFIIETGSCFGFKIDNNGKILENETRGKRQKPFDLCSINPDYCNNLLAKITKDFRSSFHPKTPTSTVTQSQRSQAMQETCEMALEHAFDLSIQPIDEEHSTLHDLVIKEIESVPSEFNVSHLSLIKLLLATGANIDAKGQSGKTPRELVQENKHVELNKLFRTKPETKLFILPILPLEYKQRKVLLPIIINDYDSGRTPALHLLLDIGKLSIIQILISQGHSLKESNVKGQTFLLYLIEQHQKFIIPTYFNAYKSIFLLILQKYSQCIFDQDLNGHTVFNYVKKYPAAMDPQIYRTLENLRIKSCSVMPTLAMSPIYNNGMKKKKRSAEMSELDLSGIKVSKSPRAL